DDYAIAICGSSISLGILSEARLGSSSGDLITARTFQIPACGTFMLHERTTEAEQYFAEGREAEFYSGTDELVEKVKRYLDDPVSRAAVARGGLRRSMESGYSADQRMRVVLDWIGQHSA
ncbi:MAG TPA: glycosyltransferase, partial [Gemmatimonadaceae bacterium]|nr:glycosyltransferase [Gemmatimonadaceae bacterium]